MNEDKRKDWKALSDRERSMVGRKVVAHSVGRITFGGLAHHDTPPCKRCGCRFVNVGCPKIWPIGTILLTCFKCGRPIEYIDGLLIMSVVEAIQNMHRRDWFVRRRFAVHLSEKHGIDEEMVMLALDQGMEMAEIIKAIMQEKEKAVAPKARRVRNFRTRGGGARFTSAVS